MANDEPHQFDFINHMPVTPAQETVALLKEIRDLLKELHSSKTPAAKPPIDPITITKTSKPKR